MRFVALLKLEVHEDCICNFNTSNTSHLLPASLTNLNLLIPIAKKDETSLLDNR